MADQGSEGLLSPFLRRQRFRAVRSLLRGAVLDVGCGSGLLANEVRPENYVGVEIDAVAFDMAKSNYPAHEFRRSLPRYAGRFDTIVSLAVIEHVHSPEDFLVELSRQLNAASTSRIVLTTPHPSMEWIHAFGASLGLFSKHANEQHEELLGRAELESAGKKARLRLTVYQRFLVGCNQLAVYKKDDASGAAAMRPG